MIQEIVKNVWTSSSTDLSLTKLADQKLLLEYTSDIQVELIEAEETKRDEMIKSTFSSMFLQLKDQSNKVRELENEKQFRSPVKESLIPDTSPANKSKQVPKEPGMSKINPGVKRRKAATGIRFD
ncbi:DgyrCDS2984 [Dimorphilus gyrociliatus]|uniref:DgyrCDS2984 n=1 Tax=Dimorphilus gyrociliatus TaxID=2664684 RepID=A0A7I8VGX9_9ANNE|nr:DgyrCDS2984 [Dimorphilus gyrociliatus]